MSQDHDIDVSHDLASFVSELRRLADALERSTEFTIHIDGQDVTIPEGATFSVAHESEAGQVELEFQITWSVASDNAEDEADADNDNASDDDVEDAIAEDDMEENINDADDADTDQTAHESSEDQNAVANGASETARP